MVGLDWRFASAVSFFILFLFSFGWHVQDAADVHEQGDLPRGPSSDPLGNRQTTERDRIEGNEIGNYNRKEEEKKNLGCSQPQVARIMM